MSRTRDLFFDEFYMELERVIQDIHEWEDEPDTPSILTPEARSRWKPYTPDFEDRLEPLISVDGGVQISNFAYGGFVTVARALALTHRPGQEPLLHKRVKIHIQEVYDQRYKGFIPGYTRMIAEYDAARVAAEALLDEGERPVILMDGSLYLARFPYATREYIHHRKLLAELFESLSALRSLAKVKNFPLVGVVKDSTVFYLHMELLKEAVRKAGQGMLSFLLQDTSSPFDLRMKFEGLEPQDRAMLGPFIEKRPLCDTALVKRSIQAEGYTHPLLLAPSIYFGRVEAPALYDRIRHSLPYNSAEEVIQALKAFFNAPGVAVTYWKPTTKDRPFRVDILAHALGHPEPWINRRNNLFLEKGVDLSTLEALFNHLGYWFCNDVEYNLPLRQADLLARFDRNLYKSRYEPFIVKRLEAAGVDLTGTRRTQREYEG